MGYELMKLSDATKIAKYRPIGQSEKVLEGTITSVLYNKPPQNTFMQKND